MATKSGPTQRLWRCPLCTDQHRAPSRPRRDDARRYCLTCTAETGRLVERFCPSLERQRAERASRQEQRCRARSERERQAALEARSVDGVDIEAELRRL